MGTKREIKAICGERLKTLIENEKTTQIQLSNEIFLSQQTISAIVQGKANLTEERALDIIGIYPKYRREWLMGVDDYMTHEDFNKHQRQEYIRLGRAIEAAWDDDDIFESVLKSNNVIFKPLDKVRLSDEELPEDDHETAAKLQGCPKYGSGYEVIIDGIHAGKCSFSDRDAICTAVVAYYKFRKQQFDRDISSFIEFEFKGFIESAAAQNATDET